MIFLDAKMPFDSSLSGRTANDDGDEEEEPTDSAPAFASLSAGFLPAAAVKDTDAAKHLAHSS